MSWPFQKKKTLPEPPTSPSSMPSVVETRKRRCFFTKNDLEENVLFTEVTIIETVPPDAPADPVFRDDFFYLCGRLQESPHPSLLKLLDFGEEKGRLYRAWEKRPLCHLSYTAATQGPADQAVVRSIMELLDGFLHMRFLGLSLSPALIHYLSIDSQGCFLARFPLTLKLDFPNAEYRHYEFITFAQCPDECKTFSWGGPPVRDDVAFQFQLGTLLWMTLSHQMPFLTAPHYALARGLDLKRYPFDFGPTLTPVLTKLTEPDPRKRFPTLEAAIEALRPEPERSLAQS